MTTPYWVSTTVSVPIRYYELVYHPNNWEIIQAKMDSETCCDGYEIIGRCRLKEFKPFRITK